MDIIMCTLASRELHEWPWTLVESELTTTVNDMGDKTRKSGDIGSFQ